MFGCVYFNSPKSTVDFHPLFHFNFQCLCSLFLLNCLTSELNFVLTSISSYSLTPPYKQIFDSLLYLVFGFYLIPCLAISLIIFRLPESQLMPHLLGIWAQPQLEVLREWGSGN